MKVYTIAMVRVYKTYLKYEANTQEEALEMFNKDTDKYAVELEQCNAHEISVTIVDEDDTRI